MRINFNIPDDVAKRMRIIPHGERSRVISALLLGVIDQYERKLIAALQESEGDSEYVALSQELDATYGMDGLDNE